MYCELKEENGWIGDGEVRTVRLRCFYSSIFSNEMPSFSLSLSLSLCLCLSLSPSLSLSLSLPFFLSLSLSFSNSLCLSFSLSLSLSLSLSPSPSLPLFLPHLFYGLAKTFLFFLDFSKYRLHGEARVEKLK